MKSEYKYLIKNMGLLTISNFSTKLLNFFLVPIYTNVLSTAEYGFFDLLISTINMLMPILTLNIVDGIIRFTLDKEKDPSSIFSVGIKISLIGFIILIVGLLINNILDIFYLSNTYIILFVLMYFFTVLLSTISSFARGLEKVSTISIAGIIGCAGIIIFNILFLIIVKWGIYGYFLANILGYAVQSIYIFLSIRAWRYIKFKRIDKKLEKELVAYSIPTILNSLSWWINSLSNRYIVTWICGIAENGIFSISYKIPSLVFAFQSIFSQAWSISAVKQYDDKDNTKYYETLYNLYNATMVLLCSMIILFDKPLAYFLYAKDYFIAWKYVPFLCISFVFSAIGGYIAGIFTAAKDTKSIFKSSIIGAVVNIALNIVLVNLIGTLGASLSVMISNIVIWVSRYIYLRKHIVLKIPLKRDVLSYIILFVQSVCLIYIQNTLVSYIIQVIIFVLLVIMYLKQIKLMCINLFRKLKIK